MRCTAYKVAPDDGLMYIPKHVEHLMENKVQSQEFCASCWFIYVLKAVYYYGIKIFNNLPLKIQQLYHEKNKFKLALKKFLLAGTIYSCN